MNKLFQTTKEFPSNKIQPPAKATAGVHADDTVCTHSYTHPVQLFYIRYEKQLPSDRKPTGQQVLQSMFICLWTMKAQYSGRRTEAQQHLSN